jgi:hypothetical protein
VVKPVAFAGRRVRMFAVDPFQSVGSADDPAAEGKERRRL